MVEFAWPWLLAALPLPWLARRLLPSAPPGAGVLRYPFPLAGEGASGRSSAPRRSWSRFIAVLAWCCLLVAAARPQWAGEPVEIPQAGRDLMLAVDLSGSMQVKDFVLGDRRVDRLTATQAVAGDFIRRRQGDRLGLILFGRHAYLQAPLTFDRATVTRFLDEAALGLAGQETAIGDAIALATRHLKASPAPDRVLILLTDGANTAGKIPPRKAAEIAAEKGVTVYTIGVGAEELWQPTVFGQRTRVNPSADLDEALLREIAALTGGDYLRARDRAELKSVYARLDELEPVASDPRVVYPVQALYAWPLGAGLLLAALAAVARAREAGHG